MWNAGGLAFEAAVNEWETMLIDLTLPPVSADDMAERFPHHLAQQIAQLTLDTGVPMSAWRVADGGREDREWWLDHGPEMVAKYVLAQEGREYELLQLDSDVALQVSMTHEDDVLCPPFRGVMDMALYWPRTGDVTVRDLKAGKQRPGDDLQLKKYRVMLGVRLASVGMEVNQWWGDYWLARQGKTTFAVDLTDADRAYNEVASRLTDFDRAERAGIYAAKPSSFCGACGVSSHCPVKNKELPWPTIQ